MSSGLKPQLRVKWITKDPTSAFEHDWIQYLLGGCHIESSEAEIAEDFRPTLIICHSLDDARPLVKALIDNCIRFGVVLLSDEWLRQEVGPAPHRWLNSQFCVFVFRNYYHPKQASSSKVATFGLGFKAGFRHSKVPIHNRPLVWSFAGTLHGHRMSAVNAFKGITPCQVFPTPFFNSPQGLATHRYSSLLADSKFALCPPGHVNNDTFRLYEALEAGSIPVVLRSDLLYWYWPSYWHGVFGSRPPFVIGRSWNECARQVRQLLDDQLALQEKQKSCLRFWERSKCLWANTLRHGCEMLLDPEQEFKKIPAPLLLAVPRRILLRRRLAAWKRGLAALLSR